MNILELLTVLAIPAGAFIGYHFVSPFGTIYGVLAAIAGAVAGRYIGPILGMVFLLPFELAVRLVRFIRTGRWTEPHDNRPD